MSDIGLSYDATTEPSTVHATIGIGFDGATLKARIQHMDPFICKLTPSGNVAEEILSGVAWPLAQTIAVAVPPLANQILQLIPAFDLVTIEPFKQSIDGVTLTIAAQNLSISGWNGMLKIEGQILVS